MATNPITYAEIGSMILRNGDRMRRREFHRAYCGMPEDYRAELIGGIVFEPSPVYEPHGKRHATLIHLLHSYADATRGIETLTDASVLLSEQDEVQPDVSLRLLPECGGQSRVAKYVRGAPELVAEVAHSSRAIDLHLKKDRYAMTGVIEYIVWCVDPERLYWFDLRNDDNLFPDAEGIFRSRVFPGLWIHADALLSGRNNLVMKVLSCGLKSAEHKKYVRKLADVSRQGRAKRQRKTDLQEDH